MKIVIQLCVLCFILIMPQVHAFEYVDEKTSYSNHKFLTLRLGMGSQTFVKNDSVNGTPGFSFQVALLHPLTKWMDLELMFQYANFKFASPDPIIADQSVETRTWMHGQVLRTLLYYPKVMAQPFVSVGVGGYRFRGLESKTALDFGYALQVPVGAGVRAYIAKNKVSVQAEYIYHFLFGDNQSASTLSLLNLDKFDINAYTIMGSFSFHFF